jgi:hypothetical protein
MSARFKVGHVRQTSLVAAGVPLLRVVEALCAHVTGDWGVLDDDDKAANERALRDGDRLLSCYPIDPAKPCVDDNRLWIITEADRSSTVVLLPDEY